MLYRDASVVVVVVWWCSKRGLRNALFAPFMVDLVKVHPTRKDVS